MTIKKGDVLIGVFEKQENAVKALHSLRQAGFTEEQLGLASREQVPDAPDMAQVKQQRTAGDGAIAGALVGSGVGAAAGVIAASLIPGLNIVLAGGLLTAAVGGAALGAAVGTFAGPFIAMGISEEDAHFYARHVEAGRTVVLIDAGERAAAARAILAEHGAYDDSMNAPR